MKRQHDSHCEHFACYPVAVPSIDDAMQKKHYAHKIREGALPCLTDEFRAHTIVAVALEECREQVKVHNRILDLRKTWTEP